MRPVHPSPSSCRLHPTNQTQATMPEILMIDDDQSLSSLLCEFLSGQGYTTRRANNGRTGLREMFDVPVIMPTARDDESNILRGFSIGADDYVTKPFSFAQLAARSKAVLARKGGTLSGEH